MAGGHAQDAAPEPLELAGRESARRRPLPWGADDWFFLVLGLILIAAGFAGASAGSRYADEAFALKGRLGETTAPPGRLASRIAATELLGVLGLSCVLLLPIGVYFLTALSDRRRRHRLSHSMRRPFFRVLAAMLIVGGIIGACVGASSSASAGELEARLAEGRGEDAQNQESARDAAQLCSTAGFAFALLLPVGAALLAASFAPRRSRRHSEVLSKFVVRATAVLLIGAGIVGLCGAVTHGGAVVRLVNSALVCIEGRDRAGLKAHRGPLIEETTSTALLASACALIPVGIFLLLASLERLRGNEEP